MPRVSPFRGPFTLNRRRPLVLRNSDNAVGIQHLNRDPRLPSQLHRAKDLSIERGEKFPLSQRNRNLQITLERIAETDPRIILTTH